MTEPAEKRRVEYQHTNWHCVKCSKELIQPSNEPLLLQPTLMPGLKRAKCPTCRTTRMFRHLSAM